MKRLTLRFKNWLVRRSAQGRTRVRAEKGVRFQGTATLWHGSHQELVRVRERPSTPPKILCFDKNAAETLAFFERRREGFARWFRELRPKSWVSRPKKKKAWIKSYVDYSRLFEVSTAASLVIAAEYDRARRIVGSPPPAVNLGHWNASAFAKLFEMGFFEIVGLSEDISSRFSQVGDKKSMRIVSGKDSSDLEKACLAIQELSRFVDDGEDSALPFDSFVALNTAMSEAMSNVTRWAYTEDAVLDCPHVSSWWVCATADRLHRTLTVVLYDQGNTIPATYPRKSFGDRVRAVAFRARRGEPHRYQDDGVFIRHAVKPGKTNSDLSWRGKGLPQMVDLIKNCEGGRLVILSRGGLYRYVHGERPSWASFRHSIGGTLIEWTLALPKGATHG